MADSLLHRSDVAVNVEHLGQMLLSALRYAMGRRTYITGVTADMVRAYWPALPDKWRDLLERDLREELRLAEGMTGTLGDRCDHEAWVSLLAWFEEEREREKAGT